MVAVGTLDGQVIVYDMVGGAAEVARWAAGARIDALAWSPDGSMIATRQHERIATWGVETASVVGEGLVPFELYGDIAIPRAYLQWPRSTNGPVALAVRMSTDGSNKRPESIVEATTGRVLTTFAWNTWSDAAVSPDGRALAYFRNNAPHGEQLVVRDLEVGSERLISPSSVAPCEFAWSNDGRHMAVLEAASDPRGVIRLARSGERVGGFPAEHYPDLAWSIDDTTVFVHRHVTGDSFVSFDVVSGQSRDPASVSGPPPWWVVPTGAATDRPVDLGHARCTWSPTGDMVATGRGTEVHLWSLETGDHVATLDPVAERIDDLAWGTDHLVIRCGATVHTAASDTGAVEPRLHIEGSFGTTPSPNGRFIADLAADNRTLRLREVGSGTTTATFTAPDARIVATSLAWNRRDVLAMVVGRELITCTTHGDVQRVASLHDPGAPRIQWAGERRVLAVRHEPGASHVQMWTEHEPDGWVTDRHLTLPASTLAIAFSPDGGRFALLVDGALHVGRSDDGATLTTLPGDMPQGIDPQGSRHLFLLDWSPDGHHLLGRWQHKVQIWNARSGERVARWPRTDSVASAFDGVS